LATRIGAVFTFGLIGALALAISGGGYYYAVYVPGRDAALSDERAAAAARAVAEQRARLERVLAQQQEAEQRQAVQQAAARLRYQACTDAATAAHAAAWAAECKRLADKVSNDRSNCLVALKLPPAYCESSYKDRDGSPNCRLPDENATGIDADFERTKYRCQREREAAE
jgi:hypothetical protein